MHPEKDKEQYWNATFYKSKAGVSRVWGGKESLPLAAVAFPEAYILEPIPLKWLSREFHDWLSVTAWQVEYLLVYVRSPRKKSQGYMKQKLVKLAVPCVYLLQSLIQSSWVLL